MQDMWMEKENKRKKEGYYRQKRRRTERDRVSRQICFLGAGERSSKRSPIRPRTPEHVLLSPSRQSVVFSLEPVGRVSVPPPRTCSRCLAGAQPQPAAGATGRPLAPLPLGLVATQAGRFHLRSPLC